MFMTNDYAIEKNDTLCFDAKSLRWLHIEILCQSLESNIWLSIYNTAVLEILYNYLKKKNHRTTWQLAIHFTVQYYPVICINNTENSGVKIYHNLRIITSRLDYYLLAVLSVVLGTGNGHISTLREKQIKLIENIVGKWDEIIVIIIL